MTEAARGRLSDVCADIDVWRDERPGTALAEALDRLGGAPSARAIEAEYGRLLGQASRHGVTDEEVAV